MATITIQVENKDDAANVFREVAKLIEQGFNRGFGFNSSWKIED